MNPVYVQGYTYIIFILICMYMNFHTSRMKFHIRNGGVFLSLPTHRKPSFRGGTNLLYGAFSLKKDLECSTLCQAGIVYKKESI